MDWMASNVIVKIDKNENYFPDKEHRDNKIDGMMGLFLAVNRIICSDDYGVNYNNSDLLC